MVSVGVSFCFLRRRFLRRRFCWVALFAILASMAGGVESTHAESWGSLKGRFVYEGEIPKQAKCNVDKDGEICKKEHPLVESLIVDPEGGVANVGVWLVTKGVDPHPDYEKNSQETIVMDNKHCRFEPHFAAVRVGQTLRLTNSDPVSHNVNGGSFRKNRPFNDNLPPANSVDKVFTAEERLGVPLSCGSHGWMKSWVLVKETPYVAISNPDGTFEIANLPAGTKLEFKTWHAPSGYIMSPKVAGKEEKWKRGQFEYTIQEGENDLGDILLSPKELQ